MHQRGDGARFATKQRRHLGDRKIRVEAQRERGPLSWGQGRQGIEELVGSERRCVLATLAVAQASDSPLTPMMGVARVDHAPPQIRIGIGDPRPCPVHLHERVLHNVLCHVHRARQQRREANHRLEPLPIEQTELRAIKCTSRERRAHITTPPAKGDHCRRRLRTWVHKTQTPQPTTSLHHFLPKSRSRDRSDRATTTRGFAVAKTPAQLLSRTANQTRLRRPSLRTPPRSHSRRSGAGASVPGRRLIELCRGLGVVEDLRPDRSDDEQNRNFDPADECWSGDAVEWCRWPPGTHSRRVSPASATPPPTPCGVSR